MSNQSRLNPHACRITLLALALATFTALALAPGASAAPTRTEDAGLSKPPVVVTGDLTAASNTVTNLSSTAGLEVGQAIAGEKIPAFSAVRIGSLEPTSLSLVNEFGSPVNAEGTQPGVTLTAGLRKPCGIDTDAAGNVYVAEEKGFGGRQITVFKPGEPWEKITSLAVPGITRCGLAVDANGNIYTASNLSGIAKYAPSTSFPPTASTTYSLDNSINGNGILVAANANAVAVNPSDQSVYVSQSQSEQQTLSFTGSPTGGSFTLENLPAGCSAGTASIAWGTNSQRKSNIENALKAACPGAAFTVTQAASHGITFAGNLTAQDVPLMTCNPSLTGGTSPSCALAQGAQGAHRIASYNPDGTLISDTIGSTLPGANFYGVDVYGANGRVYTVDANQNKAYILDPSGSTVLASIDGSEAAAPFAEMSTATLAVDQTNGNVLVSDMQAHKAVVEFNAAGKFIGEVKRSAAPEFGAIAPTSDLAVDNSPARKGTLYVPAASGAGGVTGGAVYAYSPLSPTKTLATSFTPGGSGSIKCNGTACAASYAEESSISLEAQPEAGFALKEWKGGTGSAATCNGSSTPTCTITLSQDSSIEAEFALAGFQLSVTKQGTGQGKVTSTPAGIDCGSECEETFAENTPVTLTATPEPGSAFKGWGGDCSGTGACEVTMSAARSVSATFAAAPTVTTTAGATNILPKAAEVAGSVDPNGSQIDPGSCEVEYGTDTNYGSEKPCSPADPGAGTSPVAVSASLTGLAPGTTYHFRFVATNEGGTGQGTDQTFTTAPLLAPEVTTKAATSIGKATATLNGSVNPKLEAVTDCKFEYETAPVTLPYDSTAPCSPSPGSGNSSVEVSAAIGSLAADTTYQFRLVATNGGGTTNGSEVTFKTLADEKPAIASLSPSQGPAAGGNEVTITGINFTGASAVKFGSADSTAFTVESPTQIKATAPAGSPGTVAISVTTAEGTSADTAADDYTYVAAPAVSSLSPSQGPSAGGTEVTITGTGFTGASAVKFGGTNATAFTVEGPTQIKATSPSASAGVADVTVTTVGGTSADTAADDFTYHAAPTITNLNPSTGPPAGGNSVTITGTGFTGASTVKFGATDATAFTVDSATQITATAPAGTGTVDVSVTTIGGTSANTAADNYSFGTPPALTSCAPSAGPLAGGTQVTITGTDLTGATAVKFGAANATSFTVESPTQIKATSPAGTGTVEISVTTPAGSSSTGPCPFTYTAAPTVSSLSPNQGPTAGATEVTIVGTNLTGASAVKFGAANATSFTVESPTQVKATAPAGSAGAADVTVTTSGGTSATGAQTKYAYIAVPTIASVSPDAGPSAGGDMVTITGTGLSGASFKFGAASATGVVIGLGGTSATMTVPAGSTGTVDVTATTAGGTSPIDADAKYTYADPPGLTTSAGATGISQSAATVNAEVDPNGVALSKCEVEYGPTAAYGSRRSCASLPGAGTDPVAVQAVLSGLSANTTYHFRFIVVNAGGTMTGPDRTFATLAHTCETDSAACPPKADPEVPQDHSGPPAPSAAPMPPARKAPRCRKGFKRKQVKGKVRCVKHKKKKARKGRKGRRAR
ncbi:MAG TPA: IPT/TIG domain-containing protein [Solirubrobacterales bacterium]|nr:IPT/TIG domain-containing protein [Solirubrobacterales bacterium]